MNASDLTMWRLDNGAWVEIGRTSIDTSANCVQLNGLTELNGAYALAATATPTAITLQHTAAIMQPKVLNILLLAVFLTMAMVVGAKHNLRQAAMN